MRTTTAAVALLSLLGLSATAMQARGDVVFTTNVFLTVPANNRPHFSGPWACCYVDSYPGLSSFPYPGSDYHPMGYVGFSPDLRRAFTIEKTTNGFRYCVNGQPEQAHPCLGVRLALSRDGEHYGYCYCAPNPSDQLLKTGKIPELEFTVVIDGRDYGSYIVPSGKRHEHPVLSEIISSEDFEMSVFFQSHRLFAPRFVGGKGVFVARKKGGESVVVDGQEGPAYDNVREATRGGVFGDVYVGLRGKEECVVVHGRPGPMYRKVAGFTFSPRGDHYMYFAKHDKGWSVVLDGKTLSDQPEPDPSIGEVFPGVGPSHGVAFSANGDAYAYVGRDKRGRRVVVREGRTLGTYDSVRSPVFSPDGKRFAFVASIGDRCFLHLDGVTSPPLAELSQVSLKFGPQGRFLELLAHPFEPGSLLQNRSYIVQSVEQLKGKEGSVLGRGYFSWPVCKADGSEFAGITFGGYTPFSKQPVLWVNGQKVTNFWSIGDLQYAPGGELVYRVRENNGSTYVRFGDLTSPAYDAGNEIRNISLSPAGHRYAFVVRKKTPSRLLVESKTLGETVVVDGRESSMFGEVEGLEFSRDGQHYAYVASQGGKAFLVADGIESARFGPHPDVVLGKAIGWRSLFTKEGTIRVAFGVPGPKGSGSGDPGSQQRPVRPSEAGEWINWHVVEAAFK